MAEAEKKNLKDKVLEQVKAGDVKMKPRSYFVMRGVLLALFVVIVAISALFFVSFIAFSIRTSGLGYLPGFGPRGFGLFIAGLPWLLILVAVAFVVVLEILVKRYSFAYKKPLLYSVVGVLIFVVALGVFAAQTPFHNKFFERAHERGLPFAGVLYRGIGDRLPKDVHVGKILLINESGFVLKTNDGQELDVVITDETRRPQGFEAEEGQEIFVAGEVEGDELKAFGIRELTDQKQRFPRPGVRGKGFRLHR